MNTPANHPTSICPACGQSFTCGAQAGLAMCWCMESPSGLFEPTAGASCYCKTCLQSKIEQVRQKQATHDIQAESGAEPET